METPWRKYFEPRTLASLSSLTLRARRIVEGYLAGRHHSAAQGFSIEFAEHREYTPGDDLRYVDWKVFGRTDKFYLKRFEDETNLTCYLLLDVSRSLTFSSDPAGMSKLDYAKCVTAVLAWLVLHQQDAVGLVTFDREIQTQLPPSPAPSQLSHVIQVLEAAEPGETTRLAAVLDEVAERTARRGVMMLLSDLFDDPTQVVRSLRHLRHRRHDVRVLHILDPAEIEFSFVGSTRFHGLEGEPDLVADPRAIRGAYLREFDACQRALRAGCLEHQIDYHLARTDGPLDALLSRVLLPRRTTVR
jgi:uncharacterized protein (DUF58 family)